jgi:16S rRNA C967 or C1407 C5-methylase (RsmB/RsmF family)/NOL1/NOP2/fmu family ribosome biogenesis protein
MILPELFINRSGLVFGDELPALLESLRFPSPVSIRINDKIPGYKPAFDPVPWCKDGYYLKERPLFTADPLFHGGAYYVQEASSMFLDFIARQYLKDSLKVLDLCAAPGGKSTLLCQALNSDALLVSNEINRSRSMILAENLIKWGNPNVVVSNNSPDAFESLPGFFDAIVVDAPCSGEGMFRKDPGAISEWSLQNVQNCAIRQKDILETIWNSLAENGILIYSTCTYNREENEDNIQWLCERKEVEIIKPDTCEFPDIVVTDYGFRFFPHKIKGEGFFISILRKKDAVFTKSGTKYVKSGKNFSKPDIPGNLLKNQQEFEISEDQVQITALPLQHKKDMLHLAGKLNCLVNGISLYEKKGKDLIPSPQLALSKCLNQDAFVSAELSYEDAINYLKRENINLPDHPKGYILVKYQGLTLGWVKNLGNRCNNLYPVHWRIRMNI